MMMNTLALLLIVQYMYGCTFRDDNLLKSNDSSRPYVLLHATVSFNKVIYIFA